MPPPGLASQILYDFLDWKTAQKSYENFLKICYLTKVPAISLEEFETTFYGVLKENHHRKLNFRNLAKIDNLKLCILSDVLAGKSIEKSYVDMSETFGSENIDFLDFDFWFYRFYNKSYDLDYDRSLDPEPLEFLNLPMIIHHKIIDNLDLKNRFIARKVSKSLRNLIDSRKIDYSFIAIAFYDILIRFKLNDSIFYYSENPIIMNPADPSAEVINILNKNFQEMALKDLENVLKSSKNVEVLEVIFDGSTSENQFELFLKVLESTKFDVDEIYIQEARNGEAMKILSFFKPGKLNFIYLESISRNGNADDLVKLDQFKMAKSVDIEKYGSLHHSLINRFFRFNEFELRWENIKREDVIFVRNALEKLPNNREWAFHSDNFDRIEVEYAIDQSKVIDHYDHELGIYYKTKVPNSEYFISFYVDVKWDSLTMKRHK
ncbi:unnamed protein product [Caenorhabditis nigoni]